VGVLPGRLGPYNERNNNIKDSAMTISLYDVSVGTYLQLLQGTIGVMEKGSAFFHEKDLSADSILEDKLSDDMLPFDFQVRSVVHHSLGCIRGLESGLFQPPPDEPGLSYAALLAKLIDAKSQLEAMQPEDINALMGKPVLFKMGSFELPFVAENFVLSFSLPNFYFHTTTTYNLLRRSGVNLGKVDFLGPMKAGS
jgi:uncharacterized protein